MQKQSFSTGLGITTFTVIAILNLLINPTFSQSSQSSNSSNQLSKAKFLCKQVYDKSSGEKIPATVAWVPERKGHVYFVGWKSEYFNRSGWSPKKRCQKVTKKFQKLYDQNRLRNLTYGIRNGYPVICASNKGEICSRDNHLFTVKLGRKPEVVLQKLMDIAEGKTATMLLQSSGKEQMYISVPNFLSKAPLIGTKYSLY